MIEGRTFVENFQRLLWKPLRMSLRRPLWTPNDRGSVKQLFWFNVNVKITVNIKLFLENHSHELSKDLTCTHFDCIKIKMNTMSC